MRSAKSLIFATLFSVGHVVAQTLVTTIVQGGQTLLETEIISLVGASGGTSTIALIQEGGGMALTATIIVSPSEEVFIQDIDLPGEVEHEHLDCKIASNGVATCVESVSASEGNTLINTVVTFLSTFPVPTAAPTPTPAPSQTAKPGSPSGTPSPAPSQAPNSSSKPSSIAASATAASSSSSSAAAAAPPSNATVPSTSSSSSANTPAVAPPSGSSSSAATPITPGSTNSTGVPVVTVTSSDGSLPSNGTTPPNNGAGTVGPNFVGVVAFMAVISGMM